MSEMVSIGKKAKITVATWSALEDRVPVYALALSTCHTNNCPVGIATQKPALRQRLVIDQSAARLTRFLEATSELMAVLARACGHAHLRDFQLDDLTTYDRDLAHLTGIPYAGVGQP